MMEATEILDEELKRLSEPVRAPSHMIDSGVLKRPLARLLSKDALCVDVSQTVGDALERMRETDYGAVCVTEGGKLVGLLTERDLVTRVFGVMEHPLSCTVEEVMTPKPPSLQADDEIVYACHNLHVGGYRHLPVVDADERPVSVVSIKDVFRYLLGFFQEEVSNVTETPYRGPRVREGA